MKNKRAKSTKFGSNRKKVSSDVSPSTSIPPLVEGQVRCFLRATMGRVVWAAGRPPPVTLVRLRWWGEAAGGTLFRPRDGALAPHRDVKDTARFPVRCGPKQFTSYLTDMGLLVLDVLTKPDHLPIARVQIAGIARLSLSHSINGFFTLVSPTSEKLGKLQVTLALEPLTETYDGSSSMPTTDMSTEVPESVPGLRPPALSLCAPSSAGRESVGNSSSSTPRGKDHLYFQGRGNVPFTRKAAGRPDDQQNILPAPTAAVVGPSTPGPDASLDLLSVLLERGSKLSNAMVISALRSDIGSDMALKDTPFPLPRDNAGAAPLSPPMPSSGRLLQDILRSDLQSSSQDPGLTGSECMAHMHSSAVDLLLGSVSGSVLPVWDGESSPPGLFSACSSLLLDSDFSDPQYDQSLLENLFYRAPSDSCLSPTEDESHCKHSSDKKNRPVENSGQCARPEDSFPELSVDRVALLGRIRLARVSILQLALPTNTTGTPRMLSKRGRPPLPLTTKKCSYFVEYFFPLPSSDKNEPGSSVPAEVTRVVSSKVVEGALNFRQRSVFPVHFDGPTIKRWWDTNLPFKIYCRQSFQKKPVPIGMAEFPLRCVLQSDELTITTVLPVHTLEDSPSKQDTGPLKVSFELVEDKKGFSSKSRLRKVAGGAGASPRRMLSQEADVSAGPWDGEHTGGFLSLREEEYRTDSSRRATPPNHTIQMSRSRSASPRSGAPDPRPTQEEQSDVLLHVLLMVPDGKDFVCSPMQPNVYLNCKLFGSEECTRSMVSWGQTQPTFSLVQVAPLTLTSKLLERMRNNVMVIEVWLRTSRSDEDKLLGLVKLPLHQFYMSFRDPKVSQLLLQAEYPVVAVDGYVPVVDIFTGDARGSLRVCLAMGHAQQVVALQRGRDEEMGSGAQPPRPTHLLDQSPAADRKAPTAGEVVADVLMEHVFVVRVEKVKGLTPLQSTVWGEADCYTQYSFPTQEVEAMEHINPHTVESTLDLKPYRTATTLCVPDPVFGHCETHVLLASPGVPVQRLLLSSLASQGLANGGGIQFEVWCRYYYPNVREQLAARGTLPMAKLCAMVTLQGRSQATGTFQGQSPAEAQLFSLPLIPRTDRPSKIQPQPSGLLEVSVQYRSRPVRMSGVRSGVSPRVVYLLVGLHRAMGLQAAARALGLPYFSEVGVNALVSVQLSFLPAQESQSTRVVARTFCPEFEYHAEFCCPLLIQREGGESVSLAELLQEATAVFTVYHRDTHKGVPWRSRDGVLGLARVGLADLLHKRTGVSGWFALSLPPGLGAGCSLTPVGGLELSINFAQCADRERLLRSAQLLGWEVPKPGEEEEDEEDGDASSERHRLLVLSVSVPRAWVPVHCLLLPGHSELQRSTYCYYRYKLYEQEACCSALRRPALEQGRATLAFPVAHILELRETQPLRWYLREERLEVQLWVSFGKQKRVRPHDSDRLVGSAFINLSALAAVKDKQTISGVYPLFKRSAADMGGAALRVHIAATTDSAPYTALPTSQEEVEHLSNSGEEEEDREPSSGMSRQSHTSSSVQGRPDRRSAVVQASHDTELPDDKSFTATVSVERAMHLSLRGCPLAERGDVLPSCCVSYATADAPGVVTTAVVRDSGCPVWDHQQDCRLSKELLVDPQQLLVFKVWHRGDVERVIGFASVDLSPLLSGFQSVCGWYNITDFSGQCQGQLKVAVSPLVGVQQLRPQRQAACEISAPDASTLFSALPLCYQTTGMYRSFPSHKISSSSEHLRLLSARSAVTDHRDEHMDSVHCFHPAVQGAGSSSLAPSAGDTQHSTSALISALRKNLTELDDIQRYFSRKLSTPEFSGEAEQGRQPGQEKHGGPAYCPQTLEGDAQSVMKGVREHQSEAASSNTVRDQTPPAGQTEVCLFSAEGHLTPVESESSKTETCSQKDLETRLENISTLISPDPEESSLSSIPEDLHEDQCSTGGDDGENEEEQDEEFEEMLIEPRPLNEVTSVTDRTSPWTSVLSDPDLGSLESVEAVGQHGCGSSLPQEKQRDTAMAMSPAPSQPLTSELTDADLSDGFGSVAECACVSPGKGHSDEEEKVTVGLREEHSDEEEKVTVGLCEEHSDEEETLSVGLREEHSDEEETLSVGLREEHSDEEETLSVGLREEHSDEEEKVTVGLREEHSDEEEKVTVGLCEEHSDEEETLSVGLREEHSDEEEKVTVGLREDSTQGIQQTLYHTQQDSTSGSEDESQLPPSTGPSTTACAVDRYETHTKLCDAVEIPNFFLPSHHLEASMRALRLAPVFPSVSSGPGTVKSEGTYRRAFHPKTRIPPLSANGEETKRIAKIFATNFTEQS
ncbi:C2 domain-containing protein 3 isoform X2 [Electrophorus electricus]|uniref:C2 domain-containing protein 3 isoform X2 n=1 Tax=Electrophorus electricus TaxID=8005 RepID=UPI0015D04622|nr:C2 domain-containing protein 3 isoform X2 [Electrophorus electricus]